MQLESQWDINFGLFEFVECLSNIFVFYFKIVFF